MAALEKGGSKVNAMTTSCPSVASVITLPLASCRAKVTVGGSMGITTGASSLSVMDRERELAALSFA